MSEPSAPEILAAQTNTEGKSGQNGRAPRDIRQLSRLLEQLPPHAIEAEMSLLGSMLIDPQVVGDVLLVVRSGDDFYKPANGAIFDAMVQLYDGVGALDIVQLNQHLADREILQPVGGVSYLVELANAVPSASNARHYARLVREKAALRRLISAAGEILQDCYGSPDDLEAILQQAEQRIFSIAQEREQVHAEQLKGLLLETMAMIEANEGRIITGVPTAFTELDELTHGLQPGEMIILAARPSMGKTALALNFAEQMALQGYGVGVFSLEMGKHQLVQRLLSSCSGVNSRKIRRSMLSKDDHYRLQVACDRLLTAPLYIDDTPGLTLLQLRAKARRMAAKHGVKAIIIDYLQLMTSGRRAESRQMEITEISRGVKAMARELNVPVICLSQLNRAAEQREGHRPRMSDLRESGSLEQDADVILMLHREEYYHDENWRLDHPDQAGLAEIIIAKQRNGPTATVQLTWVSDTTRFRDHTDASPPGGYAEVKPSAYAPESSPSSSTRSKAPVRGAATEVGADDEDEGDIPF